jgi:hypothetical protein
VRQLIEQDARIVQEIVIDAENSLADGFYWRAEYERDEDLFCRKVLEPLLGHMGYEHIRYTHGPNEFGKDFVFSERSRFGWHRYYALQAKAGDLSGSVRSEVHEIITQLTLAFNHPHRELSDLGNTQHISTFIVAISGTYKGNAKEVILQGIPTDKKGVVHFLDKHDILSLIEKYWPKKR